jgi:hypothetical protein
MSEQQVLSLIEQISNTSVSVLMGAHTIPLPQTDTRLQPKTVKKIIMAILMCGYTVFGSALTKENPSDIDVSVRDLKTNFVDAYKKIVTSISNIIKKFGRMRASIEKSNISYGKKMKSRYIIFITVYQIYGCQKEIIIDMTDGDFDPPVFATNTIKACRMDCSIPKQPNKHHKHRTFKFKLLSREVSKHTNTVVAIPYFNNTSPSEARERVMELIKNDKSVVNAYSVLHGKNINSMLDAIWRINNTNSKGKFSRGIDYMGTIEIIISNKNMCDPEWCICNQGSLSSYHHIEKKRTFVTLQCCGTMVCGRLLANMYTPFKVPFCPFSEPKKPHFMRFKRDNLLDKQDNTLMYYLNKNWKITEQKNIILHKRVQEKLLAQTTARIKENTSRQEHPTYGPHGNGCICVWPVYDSSEPERERHDNTVPQLHPDFDAESGSDDELPEIGRKYGKNKTPSVLESAPQTQTPEQTEEKKYMSTMKPHCLDPLCLTCSYQMKCFQTWASSVVVDPEEQEYKQVGSLPAHFALYM